MQPLKPDSKYLKEDINEVVASKNRINQTLAPINSHAPVYIYRRLKRTRATIEECAQCSFCTHDLSYKRSKRYTYLTSQLAKDNHKDEMTKLNNEAAASYEPLAKQVAKKRTEINERYELNMLFPEQNKLVYVEVTPCPVHTEL